MPEFKPISSSNEKTVSQMPLEKSDYIKKIYLVLDPLDQFKKFDPPGKEGDRIGYILDLWARQNLRHAAKAKKKLLRYYKIAKGQVAPPLNFLMINTRHHETTNAFQRARQLLNKNKSLNVEYNVALEIIEDANEKYGEFIQICWGEIDRYQKFKFDFWRYRLAIYGFIVSMIILIAVNLRNAISNIEDLIIWIIGHW